MEKQHQFHFKEPTVVVRFNTSIELHVDNEDESEQRSWTVEPTVDQMIVRVSTVYRSSNIVFHLYSLKKNRLINGQAYMELFQPLTFKLA